MSKAVQTVASLMSPRRLWRLMIAPLVLLGAAAGYVALSGAPASAATCTKQWTGATSTSWNTNSNWSPSGAPTSADYVCVDDSVSVSNEPTTTTAVAVVGLELTNRTLTVGSGGFTVTGTGANASSFVSGTLQGTGTFTITGTLNWGSGYWTDTGATTVNSGATLNIAPGAGGQTVLDRNLTNNGTATLTEVANGGQFFISAGSSVTFTNAGAFTYSGPDTNDPGIQTAGGGAFTNNGTFTKTAGTASTVFYPYFNQGTGGTFTVQAGAVAFQSGSSTSDAGMFTGSGTGQVQFQNGVFTFNSASFAGGVNVNGGADLEINASKTITLTGTNTFTSGYIGSSGNGAGNFTVSSGTLNWVAGYWSGTGNTTVSSGATLNIAPTTQSGDAILNRNLTNNGTTTLTDVASGGRLYIGDCDAVTFTNAGTFTYSGPNTNDTGIGACNGSFTNSGTFTKSAGTAVTVFIPAMSNTGTINENAGTLLLNTGLAQFPSSPGSLNAGTYNIKGNLQVPNLDVTNNKATIVLDGAGAKFNDTSSTTGTNGLRDLAANSATGSLTVQNGNSLTVKNLTNSGAVQVGPGTNSKLTTTGNYTQSTGTTTLSDASSILATSGTTATIALNGGQVLGNGQLKPSATTNPTVTNAATFSPGSSPGTIAVTGRYSQSSAGAFNADIGGTGAGQSDQITATTGIALNGTLNLTKLGTYTPQNGDLITILSTSAGTVSGTFSSVTGTNLGNCLTFGVVYNSSTVQVQVQQALCSDLSIGTNAPADTTADPTTAANNRTWTLTVGNAGPTQSDNVTVTDTIPATAALVSAVPSQGSCGALSAAGVVSCNLGTVPANPGTPPTVAITIQPLDPGTLTNQAAVSGDSTDSNQSNNSTSDALVAAVQKGVSYSDVNDSGFASATTKCKLGNTVQYTFLGTLTHSLTDTTGLLSSGSKGPRTFFRFKFQAAGKYTVSDSAVPASTNAVTIAPIVKSNGDGTFTITWSKYATTPSGYSYKVSVTGPLGTVTTLTPTGSEKSAIYTPTDGSGTYTAKAQTKNNGTGKLTGAAPKKFTV